MVILLIVVLEKLLDDFGLVIAVVENGFMLLVINLVKIKVCRKIIEKVIMIIDDKI